LPNGKATTLGQVYSQQLIFTFHQSVAIQQSIHAAMRPDFYLGSNPSAARPMTVSTFLKEHFVSIISQERVYQDWPKD